MRRPLLVGVAFALAAGASSGAAGRAPTSETLPDSPLLTFEAALALARQRAPALVQSRTAVELARAARVGVAVPLRANPSLELGGGPRVPPRGDPTVDVELGLSQAFELGGQRAARLDSVAATVAEAEAAASLDERGLVRAVALAWVRALAGEARVAVAARAAEVDEAIQGVARRRAAAGEAGAMEAALAEVAAARSRSRLQVSRADRDAALDALAVLIGLQPGGIAVSGTLERFEATAASPDATPPSERADLRAIDASIARAGRDAALAEAERWPDLRIRLGYAREESADIATVGLALDLPVFDDGDGAVATARADVLALERRREATLASAGLELAAARADVARRAEALSAHDAAVAPGLDEADRLARRAWEAGAVPLGELLSLRRELTHARADRVALLAALAESRVHLAHATGALR